MAEAEDVEGWVDAGNQVAPLHFDLTVHDQGEVPGNPSSSLLASIGPDALSTNPDQNFDFPASPASQHGEGISPLAAFCQQIDLEMDLDNFGWSAVDEPGSESEATELGLEDAVPDHWLSEDGFIQSNWIMDQSAFDDTLVTLGLQNERLALQAGDEVNLLEQLVRHHQLVLSSRQRAFHLQQIRIAVRDACDRLPLQKRLRGSAAPSSLQRLNDVITVTAAQKKKPDANQLGWDFDAVIRPPKGRRRQTLLQLHSPGISKADLETKLRAGLVDQVCTILVKAKAPIIEISSESSFPRATVEGSIGSTRAGTMVAYIRAFKAFLEFIAFGHGLNWPQKVHHVTDYLHMRSNEPCAASVPQVFLQALSWFEKTAGYPTAEKFSSLDIVRRTTDSVIEKVAINGLPLRQAPRLPAMVIVSMELLVVDDTRPVGIRIKAFSVLLKVFCTLREDDVQHLSPKKLRILGETIVGELMRTKTTGKTKRVKELPLALWIGASLSGASWIEKGLVLLEGFGEPERDYFLPRMSSDLTQGLPSPCSYTLSASLTRILMKELKRPVFEDGQWKQSDHPLVHQLMEGFWTEHSPRAVLPSVLAVLDEDKLRIDYLGKWSPSGSQDYTRTYRAIVRSLQEKAVKEIRSANPKLDDGDIVDRLQRFCTEREFEASVKDEVVSHFKKELAFFSKQLTSPECKAWASSATSFEAAFQQPAPSTIPVHRVQKKAVADPRVKKFLVVYSNNRNFARLHRIASTSCPWVRTQIRDCMELDVVDPSVYNARCKICWPPGEEEGDESISSHSE